MSIAEECGGMTSFAAQDWKGPTKTCASAIVRLCVCASFCGTYSSSIIIISRRWFSIFSCELTPLSFMVKLFVVDLLSRNLYWIRCACLSICPLFRDCVKKGWRLGCIIITFVWIMKHRGLRLASSLIIFATIGHSS